MTKKTIYVMKNHALLKRKDGSLVCLHKEEERQIRTEYAIENIEKIILFGNIQITTQAMSMCARNNIMIIKCTTKGNVEYTLYPKEHNVGKHRLVQYKTYLDEEKRLKLARQIIISSSVNKVILLKRYREKSPHLLKSAEKIEDYIKNLEKAETIDEIRGHEAIITKEYFSNFNRILNNYSFDKRVRQHPNNEINTLMSFGYTLLYFELTSRIYELGLCPFLGFIHEIQDRKPALALDVAETFKQTIVDCMIFDLVNNKRIGDSGFNKNQSMCMLNNLGKTIFLNKFENKMMSTFYHKTLKKNVSYRDCFRLEIYKINKFFQGEGDYSGFRIY